MGKQLRYGTIFVLFFSLLGACELALAAKPKNPKKSRLLEWITPGWVDTSVGNGDSDSDAAKKKDPLADLLRNRKGAGNGDGNTTDRGGQSLVFDDKVSKNSGKNPDTSDRGGKPPKTAGDGKNKGDSITFPLYWPLCIFFDPGASNANEIVKGMVDDAAGCGVNLFVQAVTVKQNYTEMPDEFNPRQQASCNLQSIGIPKGSTMLANQFPLAAARMCDDKEIINGVPVYNPGVAGCAQLGSGGMSTKQREMMAMGNYGGGSGDSGAIPSVIVPSGWSSGVGSHEAIGHSQMGWPNYDGLKGQRPVGFGIGTPPDASGAFYLKEAIIRFAQAIGIEVERKPEVSAAEGSLGGGGWNGEACGQMRSRALPNDRKVSWNPSQQNYFQVETNPERQWNLGEPLWGPRKVNPPSDDNPPQMVVDKRKPPKDEQLFFDDKTTKNQVAVEEVDPDGRHKKKKRGKDELITSLRGGKPAGDTKEQPRKGPKIPPNVGAGSDSSSLVFDDGVKKGSTTSSSGGSGGSSSSSSASSSGAGSDSGGGTWNRGGGMLTFDDSVAKGSGGSSGSSERGPASTGESMGGPKLESALENGGEAKKLIPPKEGEFLDGDFFSKIVKKGKQNSRRTKGETLRELQKQKAVQAKGRARAK